MHSITLKKLFYRKLNNIIIPGTLVFCLLFFACGKKGEEVYKLEIKKVAHVTHIDNPDFPKNSIREASLKAELSIGNVEDVDYIFKRVKKLGVDNHGNIYVLDSRKYQVSIFAKNGKFIRSVSRRGAGPGEVILPVDMIVDEKNKRIHILDSTNSKITCYHFNGTFDGDIKLKFARPGLFFLDPNGFYLVRYTFFDSHKNYNYKIVKYTMNGSRIIQSKIFLDNKNKTQETGGLILSKLPFEARSYFTCDQKGNLYYSFSDNYEIMVFDNAFDKFKIIKRKHVERIKVTESEKKLFYENLERKVRKKGAHLTDPGKIKLPEYRQIFQAMWMDDQDRILMLMTSADDKAHIDVFNSEGIYEEKLIINNADDGISLGWVFNRPLFKGGYIYAAVMDEDGEILVKKYSFFHAPPTPGPK